MVVSTSLRYKNQTIIVFKSKKQSIFDLSEGDREESRE